MSIKRNFRGIGNHTQADMVFISAWLGPGELADAKIDERLTTTFGGQLIGGQLGFPDLFLDEDMRVNRGCARWGMPCSNPEDECQFRKGDQCNPPRFRFSWDITVYPIRE